MYGTANDGPGGGGNVELTGSPTGMADPRIESWAKADPAARAFLFWSRMPVAQKAGDAILLRDQRFMHPLAQERFQVQLAAPDSASPPACPPAGIVIAASA